MLDIKWRRMCADPSGRFSRTDSPFIIDEGYLREFRPKEAIDFLQNKDAREDEKLVILAGLAAWMIAPDGITNTKHPNLPRSSARAFIHRAMTVELAEQLGDALEGSRVDQVCFGNHDLNNFLLTEPITKFCFDMFFALGGFDSILKIGRIDDFFSNFESQKDIIIQVTGVVDIVLERRARDPEFKWRLAAAANALSKHIKEAAAEKELNPPRGSAVSSIKAHWRAMKPSAPLIYSAKEIEGGDFVRQILRDPDLEVERLYETDTTWIIPWLEKAKEVGDALVEMEMISVWPPPPQIFDHPAA